MSITQQDQLDDMEDFVEQEKHRYDKVFTEIQKHIRIMQDSLFSSLGLNCVLDTVETLLEAKKKEPRIVITLEKIEVFEPLEDVTVGDRLAAGYGLARHYMIARIRLQSMLDLLKDLDTK